MLSSSTAVWSRLALWCACYLVLSSYSVVTVNAQLGYCPATGCGPSGACILDNRSCGDDCDYSCKCDPGFAGADCSFQAVTCPGTVGPDEVQTCFNGGTCREAQAEVFIDDLPAADEDNWSCDCRAAAVSSAVAPKIVAGHQCEYVSELSCEVGNPDSDYAFCVNGGTCLRMTRQGKPHRGCLCGKEHEGRHCQYKEGTAPESELAYMREQEAIANADAGLSGVGLFFVLLALLGVFGGMGFVLYRHYQRHGLETDTGNVQSFVIPEADHDLQLNEVSGDDGEKNGDEAGDEKMHDAEII
jgi:hypothetical protein